MLTVAQFSWVHLIAAIVLGLVAGWSAFVYFGMWLDHRERRRARRASCDPLRLAQRGAR